jgi:hypothetical protein
MNLLVDTDAFCKLGVAALLEDAAGVFGARLTECGRLAALPYWRIPDFPEQCSV